MVWSPRRWILRICSYFQVPLRRWLPLLWRSSSIHRSKWTPRSTGHLLPLTKPCCCPLGGWHLAGSSVSVVNSRSVQGPVWSYLGDAESLYSRQSRLNLCLHSISIVCALAGTVRKSSFASAANILPRCKKSTE